MNKKVAAALFKLLPVRIRRKLFRQSLEEASRPKESLHRKAARLLLAVRDNEILMECLTSLSGLSLVELAVELKRTPFGVKRELRRLGVIGGGRWKPSVTLVGHDLLGMIHYVQQGSSSELRSSRIDEVLASKGF